MASNAPTPGRCNANGRNGYCEKYPVKGGSRCRFHGGASTGPTDTTHLENNDFAEGNPGGGAPELNENAARSGAWSDWRKTRPRLEGEVKEFVDRLENDIRKRAKKHAPGVDADRRERLIREYATLFVLEWRATTDQFKRGFVIEEEVEIDGETYTNPKLNPTVDRSMHISSRQLKIAEELRLHPGSREE